MGLFSIAEFILIPITLIGVVGIVSMTVLKSHIEPSLNAGTKEVFKHSPMVYSSPDKLEISKRNRSTELYMAKETKDKSNKQSPIQFTGNTPNSSFSINVFTDPDKKQFTLKESTRISQNGKSYIIKRWEQKDDNNPSKKMCVYSLSQQKSGTTTEGNLNKKKEAIDGILQNYEEHCDKQTSKGLVEQTKA